MVTAPATPALLPPLIAGYLDYLRDEKLYSVHTIAAARRDLDQFAGYCAAAHIARIEQIDAHLIRDWLGRQRRAGREAASLHRYLSTLRSWFRHLLREQQVQANPAVAVRTPKLVSKLPTNRSEERRVGKEWGSTCRSRWEPLHNIKQQTKI